MLRPIICPGFSSFQSGIFSLRWLKQLFTFRAYQSQICWHPPYHSIPALLHLGNSLPLGAFGVECLQPSLDISGKLCVSSSCISSSSSVHVSGRKCQRSTQTFDCGGIMLDGGSLVSHSSEHVGRHSSALSHQKRFSSWMFLVGHVLKGLPYLLLTLWLLIGVCYTDRGSLLQSVRQLWEQLQHLCQRSVSSVGRNGQVGMLKRVYQTMPYLLLN